LLFINHERTPKRGKIARRTVRRLAYLAAHANRGCGCRIVNIQSSRIDKFVRVSDVTSQSHGEGLAQRSLGFCGRGCGQSKGRYVRRAFGQAALGCGPGSRTLHRHSTAGRSRRFGTSENRSPTDMEMFPSRSTRMKNGTPRAEGRCKLLSRWQTVSKPTPNSCTSNSMS
jgi:hypothetical protein